MNVRTADDEKRLATLRARCALAGVYLHDFEGDFGPAYVVTRWHLTRELQTLDQVENWIDMVTGKKAEAGQ